MIKEGTPSMGGVLMIAVVTGSALLFHTIATTEEFLGPQTIAPLLTLIVVGVLGAADDYLNATTGEGIRIRQKLLWQIVVAGFIAYQVQDTYDIRTLTVPFVGDVGIEPWAYVLFAAFAIVATTNGVNFTDGLDGLAGGTLIFAFVAYLIIALLAGQQNLAILCALMIGALLGFLWFNVHPAQVFMGDSGALAMGATLAVTGLITGQILLLPLIGIIFVLEVGSDVVQIISFKLTGRRIFRMAPLHHHFELAGWDEEKITMRFWIVSVLAALLGVTFFFSTFAPTT
jgi:phospho-N-acetylmuramoyl-pentapeptide-transferase